MKSTCEREFFKLFKVTQCKGFKSFKLKKNHKAEYFYLVEKRVQMTRLLLYNADKDLFSGYILLLTLFKSI